MQEFEQRAQAERARIDPEELSEPTITTLRPGQVWLGAHANAPTEPETLAMPTEPVQTNDRKAKAIAGLIAIAMLTFMACALVVWFLWTYQPANWGG